MHRLACLRILLWLPLLSSCGSETDLDDFSLQGSVMYSDRLYDQHGFTGWMNKPVRHAVVEIADGDRVIASTETDAYGNYELQARGSGTLRLRVLAKISGVPGTDIEVRNLAGQLIAAATAFEPTKGSRVLDVMIGENVPAVGAFNILDVFTAAGEFVRAISGETPGGLIAYWEPGNSMMGNTFFCDTCAALPSIFVLGGRLDSTGSLYGDSDHFDDDVLWHEYGHFLEYRFDTLDSQGGEHFYGQTNLDLRLAWSEGWSNFTSGAIKAWLRENNPNVLSVSSDLPDSYYVDTEGDKAWNVLDFGADGPEKPGAPDYTRYATSETGVAKLLWELTTSYDIASVWKTFTTLSSALPPASAETFWDSWQQTHGTQKPAYSIFLERLMDYGEDSHEEDSARNTPIAYPFEESHNLFKPDLADEIDIVPFSVEAGGYYRIETSALTNGVDTRLRILGGDGNVLLDDAGDPLENDNHDGSTYERGSLTASQSIHDGCTLASRIDLYTSAAQTLYAEVTRSADTPLSAGRYGGYKLSITQYTPNDGDTDKTKCPAPTQ